MPDGACERCQGHRHLWIAPSRLAVICVRREPGVVRIARGVSTDCSSPEGSAVGRWRFCTPFLPNKPILGVFSRDRGDLLQRSS